MAHQHITKRALKKLLVEHYGNMALIARELGVAPHVINYRVKKDEELVKIRHEARRMLVDKATLTLVDAAKNGNVQAAEKVLQYYGRHDGVMPANIQKVELSEEEQERIVKAVRKTFEEFLPNQVQEAQTFFMEQLARSGEHV